MTNDANDIAQIFLNYAKQFSQVLLALNEEGCVDCIHTAVEGLFTEPRTHMIGTNWFDDKLPEHAYENAIAAFASVKQSSSITVQHAIYPIYDANQKERFLSWHSIRQNDDQQRLAKVWMAGFELSASELAQYHEEQRSERNSVTAQTILDNAVEGIVTVDTQGLILSFNHGAENIFFYTSEEVIGKNIKVLMPPPFREEHDQYIQNYLSTGRKKIIGIGREVTGLRKDGVQFPMELSVAEVRVESDRHFVGIIRDLSERKQAQDQIIQRDQELQQIRDRMAHMDRLNVMGEMATGIAHELNQPLTAIATYAQASGRLLDTTIKNADDLTHSLNQINEQAQRAGEVIRRLRNMVAKQAPVRKHIDIKPLIRESLELAKTDNRMKDIAIHVQFAEDKISVEIDTIQIQQVLLNLIRNAIDAMENNSESKGKRITIKAERHEHQARVSVIDNGSGLLDICANEIFNPFSSTKNHGMGMGLAICQSIIQAHDGVIGFNAKNKFGTEFYFTLPLTYEA